MKNYFQNTKRVRPKLKKKILVIIIYAIIFTAFAIIEKF